MARLEFLPIVALCAVLYLTYSDGRVPRVHPCDICEGGKCNVRPADCLYGITTDMCSRNVCKKGPGGRCGGPSDILGVCGEGMFCSCGRCTGCSLLTLECSLNSYLCL